MSRPQSSGWTLLRPQNQPIWAPKRQIRPQNQVKFKCQNSSRHRKWKLLHYSFWARHWSQKKSNRASKSKKKQNYVKIKVRIERNTENESCWTTWIDPKTVFEPHIEPKNSPLGPQKVNNSPNIKLKSNVRIKGKKENENCCTQWVHPKTMLTWP